jgi:cyclopropane fatty-acyl-phospholipid synthase-like methyltransferase
MKTLRFEVIRKLNEQKQHKIYSALNKTSKTNYEAVGWISEKRQRLRFEKLTAGIDLNGKKILDFGCGLGAFCGYLESVKAQCEYVGIDLVDGYLKKARQAYPKARFENSSILDINEEFDYLFSSGTYAFCTKELFFEYVKKSLNISRYGYRFNMLLDADTKDFFKFSRNELIAFLKTLPCKYELESGYLDNDVTILLFK